MRVKSLFLYATRLIAYADKHKHMEAILFEIYKHFLDISLETNCVHGVQRKPYLEVFGRIKFARF